MEEAQQHHLLVLMAWPIHLSIHPSIPSITTYPMQDRGGAPEPIPADTGWKAGYNLDQSPVRHRADIKSQTIS